MKGIYTIYDRVADEIGPLMIYNTDEQAQRVFPQAFKDQPGVKMKEFSLLKIGTIKTNLVDAIDNVLIDAKVMEDITPYLAEMELEK